MIALIIFISVLVLFALFFVGAYNHLVTARNALRSAFAQIDVQLTQRYDLVPNIVETTKAYMRYEKDALEAVTKARNTAVQELQTAASNLGNETAVQQLSGADTALTDVLDRLMAISKAYPDLKANKKLRRLSEELTATETKVSFARQAYNDAVISYNNERETFSGRMLAGTFGFQPAQPLE